MTRGGAASCGNSSGAPCRHSHSGCIRDARSALIVSAPVTATELFARATCGRSPLEEAHRDLEVVVGRVVAHRVRRGPGPAERDGLLRLEIGRGLAVPLLERAVQPPRLGELGARRLELAERRVALRLERDEPRVAIVAAEPAARGGRRRRLLRGRGLARRPLGRGGRAALRAGLGLGLGEPEREGTSASHPP